MLSFARLFFFFGDLFFLNGSILLSFSFSIHQSNLSDKVYLLVFSNLAWFYLALVANPYNVDKGWSVSKILKTQLAFLFIHLLVVASLIVFLKKNYSIYQIGLIYALFIPVFFSWKIVVYYLRKIFSKELLYKNYVLIGRNAVSEGIRRYYLSNSDLGYRFIGYLPLREGEGLVAEIKKFNRVREIHEIFFCSAEMNNENLKPLVDFGLDSLIKVRVVTDALAMNQNTIQLDRFDRAPMQDLAIIPLDESRYQFVKRFFDLLFSVTFIMLMMSWLLPIIALLIKLDSKGPVFFVQLRSGKDNKAFQCLKFRTMKMNIEADSMQATKDDPRITKFGAFLRKTSIDELPQFFNVFIGTMSVIGPRPHMLKHTVEYSKLIERFMGRHYVKPGITGLAQCLGYRGETKDLIEMENRVRMDRYYIENWSFWLDIKIIFLTIVSLIRGSDKAF
jgi:putative colanic acid biosysnthesis UDP-glucose lipid carrier transferase